MTCDPLNSNAINHMAQEEMERCDRIKDSQSEFSFDATFAGYSPWKFPPDIVSLVSANTSWTAVKEHHTLRDLNGLNYPSK